MNVVVCDDIDGGFQRSGELARLNQGTLKVCDTLTETRAAVIERLRDAQVAIAIRDRTVFDRDRKVYLDRPYYRWRIRLNWPNGGEIVFGAVSFTQTLMRNQS